MNKHVSFVMILIFISGTFVATFNPVLAADGEDSWNTMAPMNQARSALGVVAVDGKIYAIGGSLTFGTANSASNYLDTNECYDSKSNTWTTLTSMPTPRQSFAIAACEGKIYCIGGYGYTEEKGLLDNLVVNEVYDIASDSWSTKTPLPISGSNLQAQVVDEKIFVIVSRLLYVYDPVADSWTQKASLPKASDSDPDSYSAVIDNQIIVITYFDEALRVLSYDPKTDKWSEVKQDRNTTNSSFGSAVAVATLGHFAPQKIYVLSGGSTIFFNPISYIAAYDPSSGVWEQVKEDPTPRLNFGVAVLDDVLYVIGGVLLGTDGQIASSAVNAQYVPIGYNGPALSDSDSPADNMVLVSALVGTTAGVVVAGVLLFIFKNKEKQ